MLFDDKDLRVFDNNDSRMYFKEILQCYYSENYRATVVLLYSFVIYDLYIKLQTMDSEGDKKAHRKLEEIKEMISEGDKYSKVENKVIEFFEVNCPLYFDRFIEDVNYLRTCRNKCAHLKVNDNTLFVPNDYHVRMLICSMYENILSVKAPFIMDLFSIVKNEIEAYSDSISYIPSEGPPEAIRKTLETKYLSRLTYDSLLRSYRTFVKLLLVSEDDSCRKNINGLYVFVFAMTEYIVKNGYSNIFQEESVISIFLRIKTEELEKNDCRRQSLISIMSTFSVVMDLIRANEEVFSYIRNNVLLNPQGLHLYRAFEPRSKTSIYQFFKEKVKLHSPEYSRTLYKALKDCDEFDMEEYMNIMVKAIPHYYGFDAADSFMSFFKEHLEDVSIDAVKEVMKIYKGNNQCTQRMRHTEDNNKVMQYIQKHDIDNQKEIEEETIECEDNGITI